MLLVNFLKYLGVTLPLMAFAVFLFTLTTPYREFKIMFDGDVLDDPLKVASAKAVALDLGGKVLGIAILMSSAIYHAVSLWDLIVWALTGTIFLIAIYYLFELLTPGISIRKEIPQGNIGVAIFSFCLSLTSGILMAALISY
jgi:putative membrane protein